MELPLIERIELIKLLYFSLDSPDARKYIDKLWAQEIEDRISAYESGDLLLVSADDVFAKVDRYRRN
ncbi:MAG: addiction module protein [Cyanobacteria bacterium P01_G01_bin.54]